MCVCCVLPIPISVSFLLCSKKNFWLPCHRRAWKSIVKRMEGGSLISHCLLLLNNIPLCRCTTFCLSIHILKDIWLLAVFVNYECGCNKPNFILDKLNQLGKYLGVWLLRQLWGATALLLDIGWFDSKWSSRKTHRQKYSQNMWSQRAQRAQRARSYRYCGVTILLDITNRLSDHLQINREIKFKIISH